MLLLVKFSLNSVVYYQSGSTPETSNTSSKVLASGFKLYENWEMTLDLKVLGPTNLWSNILIVRKKGLQSGEYGSRIPRLVMSPNRILEISASLSANWNWYWDAPSPILYKNWFNLKLRHYDGKLQIFVDNVLNHEYINTYPQEWDDMELVLGSYPTPTIAEYKNFLYQGFPPGKFLFLEKNERKFYTQS